MEIKPWVSDSSINFYQDEYFRAGRVSVVPENKFDNLIVEQEVKKRSGGGGNNHLILIGPSNNLIYDSARSARKAVKVLNEESEKLRASRSKKKSKK
jgi:hypothetical protein